MSILIRARNGLSRKRKMTVKVSKTMFEIICINCPPTNWLSIVTSLVAIEITSPEDLLSK